MPRLRNLIVIATLALAAHLAAPAYADSPPVDLNSATVEQLNSLSGIGDAKARAIVAYRDEHGPFRSVDQLLDVKGIGDKLLASLKPQLTVSAAPPAAGAAKSAR